MAVTLILIGIFIGFYFMILRPLRKRYGVRKEPLMPEEDSYSDPSGDYGPTRIGSSPFWD